MRLTLLEAVNQAACSAVACASGAAGNTHLGSVFIAAPQFISCALHAAKVGRSPGAAPAANLKRAFPAKFPTKS